MTINISIGDPVEVKFARYDPSRGRMAVIEWRPATVVGVNETAICVAFADHNRMTVRRGRGDFRRMSRDKDMG